MIVLLGVTFEFARRKKQSYDTFFFFNSWYVLGYGVIPLLYIAGGLQHRDYGRFPVSFASLEWNGWIALAAYAWYLFLVYTERDSFKATSVPAQPIDPILIHRLCWIGLAVSLISLLLYAKSFGSLDQAIRAGAAHRYGIEKEQAGPTAVFKYGVNFSLVVMYYAFYARFLSANALIAASRYTRLFLIACLIQAPYLLINSSRGGAITAIGGLFFILAITRKKRYYMLMCCVAFLAFGFVYFGKPLFTNFHHLAGGSFSEFWRNFWISFDQRYSRGNAGVKYSMMREGLHCIFSLATAERHAGNTVPHTFFAEYPRVVGQLVPQRFLGLGATANDTISRLNTRLLTGRDVSSTPPGILGAFYYAANAPGIIFALTLYAMAGAKISRVCEAWIQVHPGAVAICVPIYLAYGEFVFRGDPKAAVYANFSVIITVCVLVWLHMRQRSFGVKNVVT